MGTHVDVPGMGILGGSDFSNGDMVLSAIEEADERHAAFDAEQQGEGVTIPRVAQQSRSVSMPSAAAPPSPIPDPVGIAVPSGPVPPGGRPPGYAVGTQHPGSASAGAGSLLASLGAAAASGFYFKDPKAAAAGFLVTGSALNLYHGQSAAKDPNPVVAQEGTWSTVAAAVGLGLGCYLAYGVYKGSK